MKNLIWTFCLIWPAFGFSAEPERAFIELAKKVRKSVVNISTTKEETKDIIQFFPGYFMPFNVPQMTASGSGFIVDQEGLIITNAHVVQNFDKIQVQFVGDKKFYLARVLGADPHSDIALLKVDIRKKLIPIQFGDSEKLEVGEWVAAIGNPHGYGHTMTKGIISAVKREIDDLNLFPLLQTDASINPGNSGGPLVNLKGEVVGVNQAIARGAMGISFAIPINNVKEVFKDLKSFGYVKRAFIGVEFHGHSLEGVVVTNVVSGSPAERAGLKINDRIIEFDGKEIKKSTDLPKVVRRAVVGKRLSLKIVRSGKQMNIKITPQMREKNSFSSLQPEPPTRRQSRGLSAPGGFRVVEASAKNLKAFGLPDLGARNPLVLFVQKGSPAFKGGLKAGDLLFQINGQRISKTGEIRRAIRSGSNRLNVLRYHRRYDKYLLITVNFTL